MSDTICFGRCHICERKINHPPIKVPVEVQKSKEPGLYDVQYVEVCVDCSSVAFQTRGIHIRKGWLYHKLKGLEE